MARFQPALEDQKWFRCVPAAVAPAVEERLERLQSWTSDKLDTVRQRLRDDADSPPAWDPAIAARFRAASVSILDGFARWAAAIGQELRAAKNLRVPIQPCLRDVWHDHVLFCGDEVSGLIDPGAARTDTVAADLSRLLGSLVADDAQSWTAAIAAYQTVRRLSPAELQLVGILDRSGTLLSGMTWVARRYFSDRPIAAPESVVVRMEKIAGRLTSVPATLCDNRSFLRARRPLIA
jgi:Ser/Thr protein kinase RdoA (MazF antagonist)